MLDFEHSGPRQKAAAGIGSSSESGSESDDEIEYDFELPEGWQEITTAPPLGATLVGTSIVYNWGDGVGWCFGKIKKQLKGKRERGDRGYNYRALYEDNDQCSHKLSHADYSSEGPLGPWVAIKKI